MKLYDFTGYPESNIDYGGNSGLKLGILMDGEPWMIKFPKSTIGFRNVEISYTTSPLSEYIGSQVYGLLKIPVHRTRLGIYKNKVVVACKDILKDKARLIEFRELRNRYSPEMEEYFITSQESNARGIKLKTIETLFCLNPAMKDVDGLEEHFWNMFIVDTLIGNSDRNNGNWGVLVENGNKKIAPVYDNGNAFRNKASDEQLLKTLQNVEAMRDSAYRIQGCFFEKDTGKPLNPNQYILKAENPKCNQALERIISRIDLQIVKEMIAEIPEEWKEHKIISPIQREYYFRVMKMRYEEVFLPALEKIKMLEVQHREIKSDKGR